MSSFARYRWLPKVWGHTDQHLDTSQWTHYPAPHSNSNPNSNSNLQSAVNMMTHTQTYTQTKHSNGYQICLPSELKWSNTLFLFNNSKVAFFLKSNLKLGYGYDTNTVWTIYIFFELLSLSQIQLMIYFINPKCICCDTYNDKSGGGKVQNLIIHFYLSCRCLRF